MPKRNYQVLVWAFGSMRDSAQSLHDRIRVELFLRSIAKDSRPASQTLPVFAEDWLVGKVK